MESSLNGHAFEQPGDSEEGRLPSCSHGVARSWIAYVTEQQQQHIYMYQCVCVYVCVLSRFSRV